MSATVRPHDLKTRKRGAVVVVTHKSGSPANVRLLSSLQLSRYKKDAAAAKPDGGGLLKRGTLRIPIPRDGHWYVVVDHLGLKAGSRSSVEVNVEPPPMAAARTSSSTSSVSTRGAGTSVGLALNPSGTDYSAGGSTHVTQNITFNVGDGNNVNVNIGDGSAEQHVTVAPAEGWAELARIVTEVRDQASTLPDAPEEEREEVVQAANRVLAEVHTSDPRPRKVSTLMEMLRAAVMGLMSGVGEGIAPDALDWAESTGEMLGSITIG